MEQVKDDPRPKKILDDIIRLIMAGYSDIEIVRMISLTPEASGNPIQIEDIKDVVRACIRDARKIFPRDYERVKQ